MLFTASCWRSTESVSCSLSSLESSGDVHIRRSRFPGGRKGSGLNPTNTPTLSIWGSPGPPLTGTHEVTQTCSSSWTANRGDGHHDASPPHPRLRPDQEIAIVIQTSSPERLRYNILTRTARRPATGERG